MRRYDKISIGDLTRKIEISQRHFELWEAEEIIPTMEFYVRELLSEKKQIESLKNVLSRCQAEKVTKEKEVVADPILVSLNDKLKHRCKEYFSVIEKIAELGVMVDDLDVMSFDFYSWFDGEEILLCWQSGESSIGHWHYPEESFSERRELDVVDILSLENKEQLLH